MEAAATEVAAMAAAATAAAAMGAVVMGAAAMVEARGDLEVLVTRWDVEIKTDRWTAKTGYVNLNARLRYHYLRAPYRLVSEEIAALPKTQRPPPLLCPYLYELDELESRPGPSLEAVHDRAHLVDHLVSVVSRK